MSQMPHSRSPEAVPRPGHEDRIEGNPGLDMQNLTIRTGNCPHRRYIPDLVRLTASGAVDPATVLTQVETVPEAVGAYESFDRREAGWIKTALITDAIGATPGG
jgi:threonine dehydrogenase-like Zn-dependent dehydrogenase